ncbi:hypothetical protein N9Y42_10785 [Mariniblastus sp.]|nr:hypothetical protein [Mariniblastus sp.]
MNVRYSKAYIDRAIEQEDLPTLYDVVRTISAKRKLPEQLVLFLRLWEWIGSTRSGVWQYYESVPISEFDYVSAMLDRGALQELATRYRDGMACWEESRYCNGLDAWIETNESMLEVYLMQLINPHQSSLYPTLNGA